MVEAGISCSYTYDDIANYSINELIDKGVRFTIVSPKEGEDNYADDPEEGAEA